MSWQMDGLPDSSNLHIISSHVHNKRSMRRNARLQVRLCITAELFQGSMHIEVIYGAVLACPGAASAFVVIFADQGDTLAEACVLHNVGLHVEVARYNAGQPDVLDLLIEPFCNLVVGI